MLAGNLLSSVGSSNGNMSQAQDFFLPTSATNLFVKGGKELLKEGHGVPMKLPLVNRYLVSFLSVGKQGVFDEVTLVLPCSAIRDETHVTSSVLCLSFSNSNITQKAASYRRLSVIVLLVS